MSDLASVETFDDEEVFKAWFLALPSPDCQLQALKQWRQRQIRIVGSLESIIGHFGGEQYTEVDHFLLELIQNADDNVYAEGACPELEIVLDASGCTFRCNEVGFSAEHVFAICYAAASTKRRVPGRRSFIGEKGIGFKSLFAVADRVEVHSGGYHFALRDKEYIVPHLLEGEHESGSRIVARFKDTLPDIAEVISGRLANLAEHVDRVVLFLQRLRRLVIVDAIAGRKTEVNLQREEDRCVLLSGDVRRTYRLVTETVEVPEPIVKQRFPHLTGPLSRELCFAVPYPDDLGPEPSQGGLFCFLPTRVKTGFPVHVQLDGKTTTSRENLESCARSSWNAHLFRELQPALVRLFLTLRDDPAFADHLPRYLPRYLERYRLSQGGHETGNDDLNRVLLEVVDSLRQQPIVRDRVGSFRAPSQALRAPGVIAAWVENDRYAQHLGAGREFLHPAWRLHARRLAEYGCGEASAKQVAECFRAGGRPAALEEGPDDATAREFLEAWMKLTAGSAWDAQSLRLAPIYPLRQGPQRGWGSISDAISVVTSESREFPVPDDVAILDPVFTYSPGGNVAESIGDFNERFRTYLRDVLGVKRFSETYYLENILIPGLRFACARPVVDHESWLAHGERWRELFSRIGRRQRTIINDSSEERFRKLLEQLGQLMIAVMSAGGNGWKLIPLEDALLPQAWWDEPALASAYASAGAGFVSLPLQELAATAPARQRSGGTDGELAEWKQFLSACGAKQGPSVVPCRFPGGPGLPPSVRRLREECEGEYTNGQPRIISTFDVDTVTARLLEKGPQVASFAEALGRLWPTIKDKESRVEWTYYRKSRQQGVPSTAARERIFDQLQVGSDLGLVWPREAVLATPENQKIGSGLVPMVDGSRFPEAGFLEFLGVRAKIDESWIIDRAGALESLPVERHHEAAATMLRLAVRYAKTREAGRLWLRTAQVFPHVETRALLHLHDWREQGGEKAFAADLLAELREVLDESHDPGVADHLARLFELGDLAQHAAEVVDWLRSLGSCLQQASQESTAREFARCLGEQGIEVSGERVRSVDRLPLLWDRAPSPLSTIGVLLLPQGMEERFHCRIAAQALGWPRLHERTIEVANSELDPVDTVVAAQVRLTAKALDADFSKSGNHQLQKSEVWRLAREGKLEVVETTELVLRIERLDPAPAVPFWWDGKSLVVDPAVSSVSEALGQMIDTQASVTIAPFLDTLFRNQEEKAKREARRAPEAETTAGTNGSQLPEEDPHETQPTKGETQPPEDPPPASPRKRLYSLVMKPKGKRSRSPSGGDRRAKENRMVEQAGERLLQEFCRKHGLTCRDVTADDLGYDFEIRSQAGTFFVELKSSRDTWSHWEHALSPNEFRSAAKNRENYVLCVAEEVLGPAGQLHFIRDPFGLADGFLFDSPWKLVAEDSRQLFGLWEGEDGEATQRED